MTETRWAVHTLPRTDSITFDLELVLASTDPDTVAAVEASARAAGMVITRKPEAVTSEAMSPDKEKGSCVG